MVVNYQSSVFALMHVPKCYSTNCSQIWKPKVGAGVDEKGLGRDEKDTDSFQLYGYHT